MGDVVGGEVAADEWLVVGQGTLCASVLCEGLATSERLLEVASTLQRAGAGLDAARLEACEFGSFSCFFLDIVAWVGERADCEEAESQEGRYWCHFERAWKMVVCSVLWEWLD